MISHPPALAVLGTHSGAGKSLVATALCRILSDLGIRVAPFKAQNLSLNSAVTANGEEIGRAQALQASAARVEASALMNPVLLKPHDERGVQVILRGRAIATAPWGGGTAGTDLGAAARVAYDELASSFDAIILEGAGSPGEPNLKARDFVNFRMAQHAGAAAVMVGDIDRGGVYASFLGHVAMLDDWERPLLRGFLVNKFRGDPGQLASAHDFILHRTGIPVLGTIPHVPGHHLPEEDMVDFQERYGEASPGTGGKVVIGVIALDHASNTTDFDPFITIPGLRLAKIETAADLERLKPSALVLPGSKNVIADLMSLKDRGLDRRIVKAARGGTPVAGICGGFQILGDQIEDPLGIEAEAGTRVPGLGLLPVVTRLEREKQLTRRSTRVRDGGPAVNGYEIHHGVTDIEPGGEMFEDPGLGCRADKVWGTYLHGVFDSADFLSQYLEDLGLTNPATATGQDLDAAIDAFAEVVRRSVDLTALLGLMGIKS